MKLSEQAVKVLEQLKSENIKSVPQFEEEGFDQAMVNRAALELEEEGLVDIEKEEEVSYSVTSKGEEVLEEGSPENQLAERLKDGRKHMSDLQDLNLDVALGKAREKNWIEIDSGEVYLTEEGEKDIGTDPARIRLESEDFSEKDEERGLVETDITTVRTLKITEEGKEIDVSEVVEEFDVESRVKTPGTGKKHFYKEVMDYAQNVWMDMGFKQMSGDYIVPGFICFDALYIAQDHPSRDMQDTFFMKKPEKSDLSGYGETVENVKDTHENGWKTGSSGWGYEWSREEAEKNVLRTHDTAVSARKLYELEEEDLPAKYFVIGKAFRNETVDRTHLADFDQTDGIVVGKDLNFAHLKGYLNEFFEKMGYDEFRLIPTYYPYTEMSVEVQVWDEEEEEWLGMGGAGMFRPEVVEPLIGVEATVLAWGLGIGRIGMQAAELTDIRDLYSNDVKLLEETPVWRPEK